jgi:hypothetical protein
MIRRERDIQMDLTRSETRAIETLKQVQGDIGDVSSG